MMATMQNPYPAQANMGPGHPGMPHAAHPMQVQQHMGQPNPAMMAGMHPGMAGPQVTQGGPMTSMPPGPGTPASGPMNNAMMAQLQHQQNPMFQGNPQMINQQVINQRLMQQRLQQQQQHPGGQVPQNINMQQFMQMQQMQQMQQKMAGGGMPMQQMQHMTPQQQGMMAQNQNVQHQQQMLQQHARQQQNAFLMHQQQQAARQQAQQQQQAQQHAQQQQAQQQQAAQHQQAQAQQAQAQQQQAQAQQAQQQQAAAASQAMQMSRSNEPVTQPPPPQPTPTPQSQPPPQQPTPKPTAQAPQQTPQSNHAPPTPASTQAPPPNAPTPQIKQVEDDEAQTKPDVKPVMMEMPQPAQDFSGQCILQLMSYYDQLANPSQPNDVDFWRGLIARYYSPDAVLHQQVWTQSSSSAKSFQLRFDSLPRFYLLHFAYGVRKIYMQSFDHRQYSLPNNGYHLSSDNLQVTYEYENGTRITMYGHLQVNFDENQRIELLKLATNGWTEYMPRKLVESVQSPELTRQSPKITKKNLNKIQQQQKSPPLPRSPVTDYGIPERLMAFFETAEVLNIMQPLMQFCRDNDVRHPREGLARYIAESQMRMQQNINAVNMNGQFAGPRMANMQPNHFQSPSMQHLGLPQNQNSPHVNHTPSPGHQGGVPMVQQMSAQGSQISGSQASTNTSPNVAAGAKKRRQSAIKEEDAAAATGTTTKPSPRTGKRQKPT